MTYDLYHDLSSTAYHLYHDLPSSADPARKCLTRKTSPRGTREKLKTQNRATRRRTAAGLRRTMHFRLHILPQSRSALSLCLCGTMRIRKRIVPQSPPCSARSRFDGRRALVQHPSSGSSAIGVHDRCTLSESFPPRYLIASNSAQPKSDMCKDARPDREWR
jgi:hypothetical protein